MSPFVRLRKSDESAEEGCAELEEASNGGAGRVSVLEG